MDQHVAEIEGEQRTKDCVVAMCAVCAYDGVFSSNGLA